MANLFPKKQTEDINLLPEREFAGTVTGRVLSWIISTFRVIVIATEILVMVAFLSRFWLDAQNTDLNEELDGKKAILSAQQDFEQQFKDTQKRLRIFVNLTNRKSPSSFISAISQQIPPDVTLTNIDKLPSEITIEGATASERSAQQFVVNLQSTNLFDDISLTEIKTNQLNQGQILFTIKTIPKGGENL